MNRQTIRKIIVWSLFALSAAIGTLQMFKIRAGLLTSHGADFFAPALLYFLTRDGKTLLRQIGVDGNKPILAAASIFVLCAAWEIFQKIHLIPGVFDWYDLLAYALGIACAFALDKVFPKGE